MRIALGVEYCGTNYCGWQLQENASSVQYYVEHALSQVADHEVQVICAGRTDTGVHAISQVIHFDTSAKRDMRSWIFGCNANLPKDIAITWGEFTDDSFHARFSATCRRYRYVIFTRSVRPTFLAHRVTWSYKTLNADAMARAASVLIGEHDFSTFRAAGCQAKSPVRNVYSLDVIRKQDFILIDIAANAFLHHMVRNIAGVLMAIGAGEQPESWTQDLLEVRDRTLGGITAPAHGLYLVDVDYRPKYDLPRVSDTYMIW